MALRAIVCAVLCGLLSGGVAVAVGERTIGLSATTFDFSAAAGTTGKGQLYVINEGQEPVSVKVYAANQQIAEDGSVEYVTPPVNANPITSPASWLRVILPPDAKSQGNIPFVELGPGGRELVKFEVNIPEGATPGDQQALLFFEMFDPDGPPEQGTARVNARIGVRIKTRVEGEIVERLEIRPFEVPRLVIGDRDAYSFTLVNSGNVDTRVNARTVVLDSAKRVVAESEALTETTVFANSSRAHAGNLEVEGGLGRYTMRLVVEYPSSEPDARGLTKTLEEDATVWVVPLWLVIAAIVLVGLVAMWITWRGGRRSGEKRERERDLAERERRIAEREARLAGEYEEE